MYLFIYSDMNRNETYIALCTPNSIYVKFASIKLVQSTKILSLTSDLNSIVSFIANCSEM